MAQLNPKKEQRIYYPTFSGGLNLSVPPESLERNELSEAVNVEYSARTGAMTVRNGLKYLHSFDKRVIIATPLNEQNAVFVTTNDAGSTQYKYYVLDFKTSMGEYEIIGSLPTVTNELKYGLQVTPFGDNLYVLTDSNQYQIYKLTCEKGDNDWKWKCSPITSYRRPTEDTEGGCHTPFTKSGRIVIVNGDCLNFSAVGDCEDWTKNESADSSSKFIEIGYKDGLDIIAVVPLSKDVIIFKQSKYSNTDGKIYRLSGDYPDWQVSEVASGNSTFSHKTVASVGNDVYFLSSQGLQTLSTVQAYGDIKANWPDQKINQQLISEITHQAQMWDIPSKQQLWISPYPSCKHVWIFDYIHKIWTKFEFQGYLSQVCEINGVVYVFMGNDVFTLDEDKERDDINEDDRADIEACMKCGKIIHGGQTLIKGAYAEHSLIRGYHSGEIVLDAFSMPFTSQKTSSRRRCLVRCWAVTPEIKLKGGGMSISSMGLDTAEI